MSEKQEVQPHQQDDCEDCQKQRAENNQLVDFYERLGKIRTRVTAIKANVQNHAVSAKDDRMRLSQIGEKISVSPNLQMEHFDTKEMGFELACALMERQIKIKRENAALSDKIAHMKTTNESLKQRQAQKRRQSFMNSRYEYSPQLSRKPKNEVSDSLDTVIQSKGFWGNPIRADNTSITENNSSFSNSFSFVDSRTNSSGFNNFEQTDSTAFKPPPVDPQKTQTKNLNLWLYQYNVQQELPLLKSISSSRNRKK